jgi:Flp pilus assembly protein TadG
MAIPSRIEFVRPKRSNFKQIQDALRRFSIAAAGNVAMIYALALVPAVGAAGAAIDLGQAVVLRQRLAETADMAALALGSMPGLTDAQKHAKALEFFAANFPDEKLGEAANVAVTSTDTTITVAAAGHVQTAFMQLFGLSELAVSAEAEVTLDVSGVEIALALDNTGSMGNAGKLDALKTAMTSMIEIMFGQNATSSNVKMGLVPFSESVRLDVPTAMAGGWMDVNGQSAWARLHFDNNMHPFAVWNALDAGSPKWGGCVEARPNGLEETDTPPEVANPDSLWVPYFQPDEPDNGNYNSYLDDQLPAGSQDERFKNSAKYNGQNTDGPNTDCTMQKVLPLTNDKATLLSYVNGMQASGYTHIAIGAAWGWRVLSPGEPFTQGVAYGDANWKKILVLMTDGVNTIPGRGNHLGSDYTAYGYVSEARLGTQSANQAENEQNVRTSLVCDRIKATGIRVYTILLMENNQDVRDMLRGCATSPQMFFDTPSPGDLEAAFHQITAELSNLRLSR